MLHRYLWDVCIPLFGQSVTATLGCIGVNWEHPSPSPLPLPSKPRIYAYCPQCPLRYISFVDSLSTQCSGCRMEIATKNPHHRHETRRVKAYEGYPSPVHLHVPAGSTVFGHVAARGASTRCSDIAGGGKVHLTSFCSHASTRGEREI
jgi:hypothetical protein